MSDNDPDSALPSDIPSMLLAVEGRHLLLPGVAVAEIIYFTQPETRDNSPDWFLGTIEWRTLEIPLLSYELLSGEAYYARHRHIVVLNNAGTHEQLPFIAIPIMGIPRLVRVTARDVTIDDESPLAPVERTAVKLPSGDVVYIPDIAALEKTCATFYTSPVTATA